MLKKLDRLYLSGTFASDRLKKFYFCQQLYLNYLSNFDFEELSNFDNFFLNNNNCNLFDIFNDIFNL